MSIMAQSALGVQVDPSKLGSCPTWLGSDNVHKSQGT